jgi:lipopolysaccharide exporter
MAGTTKYQSWIAPGLYGGLQKLSIPLFGVISTMVLAHKGLTKPEMGVWSLFLVITGFVEMMRETSVKTSLIKYLNGSETDRHVHVMSAALFLNILITFILFIVLFVFAGYFARILLAPELKNMLYIFLAGLVLLVPFSHFTWILYAKVQFKGIFWVFLFRQGFTLLFIVTYLLVHGSLTLKMLLPGLTSCIRSFSPGNGYRSCGSSGVMCLQQASARSCSAMQNR